MASGHGKLWRAQMSRSSRPIKFLRQIARFAPKFLLLTLHNSYIADLPWSRSTQIVMSHCGLLLKALRFLLLNIIIIT